ncbi:carbon catabolite repressor protein, putative [Perkinsus marinus ATCC 50983]|uniref:Carbon catabolite repressor protein, putative n=1 Tax=Perkinsus marinus (strain ATCC 50983 / TXsc) TaxID=423536 RepID=C5LA83_PERM5|nr:carbon catabolite repressor protein, putative [Perkinsus marinus ATCC 50983]EER06339.1 carbon catabolite repressor protein, putative [Perkinsus marinus ATCC 50983]|eukprot:XP_002774523.1 carbon catabolite repressor protein, putative [Perkinsus marinus ATCC 50983]
MQVLRRMQLSVEKAYGIGDKRKLKKRKGPPPADESEHGNKVRIQWSDKEGNKLASTDSSVSTTTLAELSRSTKEITVNEHVYSVFLNPPLVTSVALKYFVFAEYPIVPLVECSNTTPEEVVYEYRTTDGEELVHSGRIFTPGEDLIGKKLRVSAYHSDCRSLPQAESDPSRPVRPSPSKGTFRDRRLPKPLGVTPPNHIRVASFNVLAQRYVRTPLATKVMYRNVKSCREVLEWEYRCPLLMRELMDVKADVFAFQEAEPRFVETVREVMPQYTVRFVEKNGNKGEGCAIAYRNDRFEMLDEIALDLASTGVKAQLSEGQLSELQHKWGQVDMFGDVFDNLGTAGQVLVLRDRQESGNVFVIGNTHLFFHRNATHVRLLQAHLLAMAVKRELDKFEGANVFICGDFNSFPDSGVVEYLSSGGLASNHKDWYYGPQFKWDSQDCADVDEAVDESAYHEVLVDEPEWGEGDELFGLAGEVKRMQPEKVDMDLGIELHHGINGLRHTELPQYTNAVCNFKIASIRAVLDYIFYTPRLTPVWSLPGLTDDDIESCNGGLPYKCYGSDHVMIATEFAMSP